jgi:hypothetical protein
VCTPACLLAASISVEAVSDFSKIWFGAQITATRHFRIVRSLRAEPALPVLFRYSIRCKSFLGPSFSSQFPECFSSPVAGSLRSFVPGSLAHLALSAARIHGSGLEFKHNKAGVSRVGSGGTGVPPSQPPSYATHAGCSVTLVSPGLCVNARLSPSQPPDEVTAREPRVAPRAIPAVVVALG